MKHLIIALMCTLVVSMTDIDQPYERLMIRQHHQQADAPALIKDDVSQFIKQVQY
ncbi:hypothetical protein L4D09_11380 [Photobacterium makurazakiensis]|uniref:hypothetical protein n=1 Tax=Photobacterium makurazakiensis TaxID=2910234 RepID=UPI003D1124AB